VEHRVPIELKIAGKWSASKLRERLESQLTEQYLRAARHGIFLVVNRGGSRDRRSWRVAGKSVNFAGLAEWLKKEAATLKAGSAKVEGLEVVAIDLLVRDKEVRKRTTRRVALKNKKKNTSRPGKNVRSKTKSAKRGRRK
jgi:hypothetical protein